MSAPAFVCPGCRSGLEQRSQAFVCASCGRSYPILFGIPDFRLRGDRYLSLEAERAKAEALHRLAERASFEAVVAHYYAITDDVPAELATRYTAYIRNAPERARAILADLAPDPNVDTLIDLGCGTGGLLAAAQGHCRTVVGLDIALRWLILARKRLEEIGLRAQLVCADVEAPPFPEASFSHAVAADLIEHVYDPARALGAIRGLLRPGGTLWLSAINRYCPGPHPSTGVWGIGWMPPAWRGAVLRRLRGVDSLRHTHLVSPRGIAGLSRGEGFEVLSVRPRRVDAALELGRRSRVDRAVLAGYRRACERPWLRPALLYVGPAFEMVCRRPAAEPQEAGA